jgi:signal transduction histidine kinase
MASDAAARVIDVSSTTLPAAAAIEALTFLAAAVTLALTYRAVRQAQSLAEKSRASLERRAEELELFAARVAHDLLSPLMTVAVALDLADRRLTEPANSAARNAVARGSRTLQRVRRFVSDLLEFARAGAMPPPGVRANVDEAIRETADELTPIARDAGVDLRVELPPAVRDVACSPGVLTSVLSNLVQNAIKYIGEGEARRVSIRAADIENEVRIEVEDTGPGIPPADQDRLFEPYARGRDAKAPGLGLGLATVRRLVESHGGRVGVQSAPGRGSVFWFSVPIAA